MSALILLLACGCLYVSYYSSEGPWSGRDQDFLEAAGRGNGGFWGGTRIFWNEIVVMIAEL